MPSARKECISFSISAFAPTSMPRVGSSRIRKRGRVASQRASNTFCWLPPLRFITGCSGPGVRMPSALMNSSAISSCRFRERGSVAPWRACNARMMFSRTERCGTMPSTFRSSGVKAKPSTNCLPRRMEGHLAPFNEHFSCLRLVDSEEQASGFSSTRTQQTCKPDDFALADRHVHRRDRARSTEILYFNQGGQLALRLDALSLLPNGFELSDSFADHPADKLHFGQFRRLVFADQSAIAQDRDPVRNGIDLIQEVGDKNDRHAFGAKLADDTEEFPNFLLVETRGGFVQHEQSRGNVKRPSNRDQLLDCNRTRRQWLRDIELQIYAGERSLRAASDSPPTNHAKARRLSPKADILGHRAVRDQVHLLVDRAYSERLGGFRGVWIDFRLRSTVCSPHLADRHRSEP